MEEQQKENIKRPLGIKILCILGWLEALVILLAGIALIGLGFFGGSLIGNFIGGDILGTLGTGGVANLIGEIMGVLGILLAILGAASFWITFWLWKMQKRGWKWAIYAQITTLLLGIVGLLLDPTSILDLIIPVIIVIYLWMKKDLFQ